MRGFTYSGRTANRRIPVDAVVALTDCDRDAATAFIRRLYLAGVRTPSG
jgi:hypothetical protein